MFSRLWRILGTISALLLAALLVVLLQSESRRLDAGYQSEIAQSIEIGAGLYELHCRTCHGSRGEGVGQLGPALSDAFFFRERLKEVGWPDTLESYILATSSHGRIVATRQKYAGSSTTAVMNPWLDRYGGPLRQDQLIDITRFILNWQATALGEVELTKLAINQAGLDDPKTISNGQFVYQNKCKDCHSIEGIATAIRKGPPFTKIATIAKNRMEGVDAETYIRHSFLIPSEYIVKGFNKEILGYQCGGVLTSQQLNEVTAFLLTLK